MSHRIKYRSQIGARYVARERGVIVTRPFSSEQQPAPGPRSSRRLQFIEASQISGGMFDAVRPGAMARDT